MRTRIPVRALHVRGDLHSAGLQVKAEMDEAGRARSRGGDGVRSPVLPLNQADGRRRVQIKEVGRFLCRPLSCGHR